MASCSSLSSFPNHQNTFLSDPNCHTSPPLHIHTHPCPKIFTTHARARGVLHRSFVSMASCCWETRSSNSSSRRKTMALQLHPSRRLSPAILLILVVLLVALAPSSCEATRGMQPFRGRPVEAGGANHFLGFLPRGAVTPSGPSRQHNSVGLESQLQNKP